MLQHWWTITGLGVNYRQWALIWATPVVWSGLVWLTWKKMCVQSISSQTLITNMLAKAFWPVRCQLAANLCGATIEGRQDHANDRQQETALNIRRDRRLLLWPHIVLAQEKHCFHINRVCFCWWGMSVFVRVCRVMVSFLNFKQNKNRNRRNNPVAGIIINNDKFKC